MACHPVNKRQMCRGEPGANRLGHPVCPSLDRCIAVLHSLAGTGQKTGRVRIGQAVFPNLQLKSLCVELMRVAGPTGMGQWMFEQRQQCFRIQGPLKKRRCMTQKPARRRQVQWHPSAVIRHDIPAVKSGRNLPCQHPIRGDQGCGLTGFGGCTQTHRDRNGFGTGGVSLDQGDFFGSSKQISQIRTFASPRIGDGRWAQGEGHQFVSGRGWRRCFHPRFYGAGCQI